MASSSSSSLSTVVSSLTRAQWGVESSSQATEADLDRAVAELIVKEAKKKAERYKETGVRAFLRDDLYVLPLFTRVGYWTD